MLGTNMARPCTRVYKTALSLNPKPCDVAEEKRRKIDEAARKEKKAAKRAAKERGATLIEEAPEATPAAVSETAAKTPIAFVFPGQGSQALGMLNVRLLVSAYYTSACQPRFSLLWGTLMRLCSSIGKITGLIQHRAALNR